MPPLAMTERMRRELDECGFTVLESFIQGAELARIATAARGLAEHGDGGEVHPIALEMMDYEPVLPLLVDAMGWNIHMRDGLMTAIRPRLEHQRQQSEVDPSKLGTTWHIDQEEEFQVCLCFALSASTAS